MANILVIDDDKKLCDYLERIIRQMGHTISTALRLKEGLKKILTESFDLVFLDVHLPDGYGLDAVPEIRETASPPEVIIITGEGEPDGAEIAIKSGSWDYIQKPLSIEDIKLSLTRVLQYRQQKASQKPIAALKREGIIGSSAQMRACFDLLAKACNTDSSVLITGETGTGKELIAKAVHDNSRRTGKTFVVVDCTALPETLVESTLFGYEKGAFTGADKSREGLVKEAHQGTLFLDEVGELPMKIQGSFLRVLQEHRFRPVGGKKEIKSEFRLITATNRNLDQMVLEGKFRKDLLFRLKSFVIDLPPLRKRIEDIKELTIYYMTKFCDRYGTGIKGLSPEFLEALNRYQWPGNVRELINAIERALAIAQEAPTLFPFHLPTNIRTQLARASVQTKHPIKLFTEKEGTNSGPFPYYQELMETTERKYFQDLFSFTKEDIKEACRISRLSRAQVYRLRKKYNITKPSSND